MAPAVLIVIAVAGGFLPEQQVPPTMVVQEITGLDAVPWLVQAMVAGAVSTTAVVLAFRRPHRLWPLFAVAAVLLVLRGTGPVLFVASYCAGLRLRRLPQVGGYVVAACLVALAPYLVAPAALQLEGSLGSLALFVGAPVVLGQWIGARHQVLDGLRARAAQHEREREMRAAAARAQERARIAGDMHDVVAHRVSLMVLYAGALEAQGEPRSAELAGLIRTTGREALDQLRQLLGVLKDSSGGGPLVPQPVLGDLDQLVARSRAAGLELHRIDEGSPRELPVVVAHAAYRVVQEALTNVHKHAGRARTEVLLRHLPDALEVSVRNAAADKPAVTLPGSGSGLIGLRERVELLGGRFTAAPALDGGFLVTAWLPAHVDEKGAA